MAVLSYDTWMVGDFMLSVGVFALVPNWKEKLLSTSISRVKAARSHRRVRLAAPDSPLKLLST